MFKVDKVLSYFIKDSEEEQELAHLMFMEYLQIIKNESQEEQQDSIPLLLKVLRNKNDIRLALEWVLNDQGPGFKLNLAMKRDIIQTAAVRLHEEKDREFLV